MGKKGDSVMEIHKCDTDAEAGAAFLLAREKYGSALAKLCRSGASVSQGK